MPARFTTQKSTGRTGAGESIGSDGRTTCRWSTAKHITLRMGLMPGTGSSEGMMYRKIWRSIRKSGRLLRVSRTAYRCKRTLLRCSVSARSPPLASPSVSSVWKREHTILAESSSLEWCGEVRRKWQVHLVRPIHLQRKAQKLAVGTAGVYFRA